MRSTTRVGVSCLAASVALLAVSAPAAANRISGALSKPGYTVIALAANGKTKSVQVKRGNFRLVPPAKSVTLHLRAPNGTYAGPIVVSGRGAFAIVGVRAGAKLGKINVRRGYARVSRTLPTKWLDAKRRARARKGVPIGAGRFGRVRSRNWRTSVPGDLDLDGIPDVLDIDDDGDLILDNLDRSTAARQARAAGAAKAPKEIFDLHTQLPLPLEYTANANAAAVTVQQIDAGLSRFGILNLEILPDDSTLNSPELDCGGANQLPPRPEGLVYCSRGGTGIARAEPTAFPQFWNGSAPFSRPPFPACCDADRDGFGRLVQLPNSPGPGMALEHGATTAQIGTGDVLIERVRRSGVESQFATAQQFVFATVPALVRYTDTAGNSATVSYPVAAPAPGLPPTPGGPGTQGNEFPVAAGPGGDVVLTLTFWRPQRRPIPPETGEWIDIGGLAHTTIVNHLGPLTSPATGTTVQKHCPQSVFSSTDPQLAPTPPQIADPGFTDLATDRPASPANTLTYTLNLTQCLTLLGVSWQSGEQASISFMTRVTRPGAADSAEQSVWFKRQ